MITDRATSIRSTEINVSTLPTVWRLAIQFAEDHELVAVIGYDEEQEKAYLMTIRNDVDEA